MNLDALEGSAVHAPLVVPVMYMLHLLYILILILIFDCIYTLSNHFSRISILFNYLLNCQDKKLVETCLVIHTNTLNDILSPFGNANSTG